MKAIFYRPSSCGLAWCQCTDWPPTGIKHKPCRTQCDTGTPYIFKIHS